MRIPWSAPMPQRTIYYRMFWALFWLEGFIVLISPATVLSDFSWLTWFVVRVEHIVPNLYRLTEGIRYPFPSADYQEVLRFYFALFWLLLPVKAWLIASSSIASNNTEFSILRMLNEVSKLRARQMFWILFGCFVFYGLAPWVFGDQLHKIITGLNGKQWQVEDILKPEYLFGGISVILLSPILAWFNWSLVAIGATAPMASGIYLLMEAVKGRKLTEGEANGN